MSASQYIVQRLQRLDEDFLRQFLSFRVVTQSSQGRRVDRPLESSNQLAAEWVRNNVASLVPGQPDITAGDVIAHAHSGTATRS